MGILEVLSVLLFVLKLLGAEPLQNVSWWLILLPAIVAMVWYIFIIVLSISVGILRSRK